MALTEVLTEPTPKRFYLAVGDPRLRRSLAYIATASGWRECTNPTTELTTVTDALDARQSGRPTVLVIAPTPFAAESALRAVLTMDAAAVICADTPDALPGALDAAENETVSLPSRVLRLARSMPQLSDRQIAIVTSVIAGRSNGEIARELSLSAASVKRELAELYRACGLTNRAGLASKGYELGLQPASHKEPALSAAPLRPASSSAVQ